MIEFQVLIVILFILSLVQSVQLYKLLKSFFVLEARQKAGAAHKTNVANEQNEMQRSVMQWSE